MGPQPNLPSQSEEEPPPVFRTWSRVYAAVLVYWILLLLTLYWVSQTWTY